MIGRSGERGSGISVLAARHDDDDDFKQFSMSNSSKYYYVSVTIQLNISHLISYS